MNESAAAPSYLDVLMDERGWAEGDEAKARETDEVEMLPVPEHFEDLISDYGSWGVVRAGTPEAVAYWRFRC